MAEHLKLNWEQQKIRKFCQYTDAIARTTHILETIGTPLGPSQKVIIFLENHLPYLIRRRNIIGSTLPQLKGQVEQVRLVESANTDHAVIDKARGILQQTAKTMLGEILFPKTDTTRREGVKNWLNQHPGISLGVSTAYKATGHTGNFSPGFNKKFRAEVQRRGIDSSVRNLKVPEDIFIDICSSGDMQKLKGGRPARPQTSHLDTNGSKPETPDNALALRLEIQEAQKSIPQAIPPAPVNNPAVNKPDSDSNPESGISDKMSQDEYFALTVGLSSLFNRRLVKEGFVFTDDTNLVKRKVEGRKESDRKEWFEYGSLQNWMETLLLKLAVFYKNPDRFMADNHSKEDLLDVLLKVKNSGMAFGELKSNLMSIFSNQV